MILISERKGLQKGLSISSGRSSGSSSADSSNSPAGAAAKQLFASVGAVALPHPFKRVGHVSPSARDHR
jgi:hypothetical protein